MTPVRPKESTMPGRFQVSALPAGKCPMRKSFSAACLCSAHVPMAEAKLRILCPLEVVRRRDRVFVLNGYRAFPVFQALTIRLTGCHLDGGPLFQIDVLSRLHLEKYVCAYRRCRLLGLVQTPTEYRCRPPRINRPRWCFPNSKLQELP